jgi:GNAT superfamily N-acetyltransferase/two-component sensor histidine kinase
MTSLYIKPFNRELEDRIRRNPSLNIDSFIIPTPYAVDERLEKDYEYSFVWEEEREILGFIEVWSDPEKKRLHIYKQVTSPFGRSKGIGSAFLAHLASIAPAGALIDLYIWERQAEILMFYKRRGFAEKERLNWRALNFVRLEGEARTIRETIPKIGISSGAADELGKIRHDAKKAIRLIADMAGALTAENCSRIIEDINRETTALINTLNLFRDSVQRFRTINLKELIIDRVIPMVEHSPVKCELVLRFSPNVGEARAHYLEAARAIVNLVSNALDAIKAAERPGVLSISLEEITPWILLTVEDNGIGIEQSKLQPGQDGRPQFVGITTKANMGEGQGTRQIYAAFGTENISVHSEPGKGTRWVIRLPKAEQREESELQALETRLAEFKALSAADAPKVSADKAEIAAYIWRCKKLEILIWDLILQFARKNNVRDIYRSFLACRYESISLAGFRDDLENYKTDTAELRLWLLEAVRILKREDTILQTLNKNGEWQGIMFKAYGQAAERTVIFTIDPATGNFGATDRKLAEHADFISYLGGNRDRCLRGEFFGDVQNPANPIQLGVWELGNPEDCRKKASLIRAGAEGLINMGIPESKKLLFYETTWRRGKLDLDTGRPRTLGAVARMADEELGDLLVAVDEEFSDYISAD